MSNFSNFAIVYAMLIIDGKRLGVNAFMVQTRDLATWAPLPGIERGDIGPKFGYNSKDNGFMLFKNVRIPRENMLRKYIEVTREGKLVKKGDMRTLYGIMMETRVFIVGNAPQSLAMALNIATRYAVVRRQFATLESGNKLERKLLDYQTHMFKFGPLLAATFALNFAAQYLQKQHVALIEEIGRNEFSSLDSCHYLSAGFKAVFTRIAYDGIDTSRQACGGAGFSAHSGLPSL